MDGYGLGEHPYPIEDRDTILGGLQDRRSIRYGGMDQDLVVRAQHGDQRAFESLAVASHPRLYRLAQGILGNPHLAEDATQQACLDIWRDIRRLRDPAKFEAGPTASSSTAATARRSADPGGCRRPRYGPPTNRV